MSHQQNHRWSKGIMFFHENRCQNQISYGNRPTSHNMSHTHTSVNMIETDCFPGMVLYNKQSISLLLVTGRKKGHEQKVLLHVKETRVECHRDLYLGFEILMCVLILFRSLYKFIHFRAKSFKRKHLIIAKYVQGPGAMKSI